MSAPRVLSPFLFECAFRNKLFDCLGNTFVPAGVLCLRGRSSAGDQAEVQSSQTEGSRSGSPTLRAEERVKGFASPFMRAHVCRSKSGVRVKKKGSLKQSETFRCHDPHSLVRKGTALRAPEGVSGKA